VDKSLDLSEFILVNSRGDRKLNAFVYDFRYWRTKGAFANGGLGFLDVLLSATFSFLGTDNGKIAIG
jgi:amino acid permease